MSPRSVMPAQARFAQIARAETQRSTMDRTHGYKTTFDAGYLIPVYVDEILPGDTVNLRMTAFARLATPLRPVMDNMFLESFFFFVPNRLVWDNWEKFCGSQDNPGDSTDFLVPRVDDGKQVTTGDIYDYMGLPLGVHTTAERINALPFRAYNLIYNEWFRDENLINSLANPTDDGPDSPSSFGLQRRGKRHDYFTSCLPWPQKGSAVDMPLGGQAPVLGLGTVLGHSAGSVFPKESDETTANYNEFWDASNATALYIEAKNVGGTRYPDIRADLSQATGSASINALRQAFQLQKLLERDARGGTRYTEILRSHFNVTSPDQRLQRPEYLGGGSTPVQMTPVPNTSGTASEDQGDLAAYGTVATKGHGFVKSFVEHGYIIGLVSVRADLTYQDGLERMWSRQTREDFFWPALAHIGEQAVLQKEIFVAGDATDEDVFGYQERYAEYRYKPSKLTGLMRSAAAGTLDVWHLSQEFATAPTLNKTFIEETPPIDRVIAVPSQPHFIADIFHQVRHARPMPLYGVPGLIDHF